MHHVFNIFCMYSKICFTVVWCSGIKKQHKMFCKPVVLQYMCSVFFPPLMIVHFVMFNVVLSRRLASLYLPCFGVLTHVSLQVVRQRGRIIVHVQDLHGHGHTGDLCGVICGNTHNRRIDGLFEDSVCASLNLPVVYSEPAAH